MNRFFHLKFIGTYVSDYLPLWFPPIRVPSSHPQSPFFAECTDTINTQRQTSNSIHLEHVTKARESLMNSGLLTYTGGIPTSLRISNTTRQQWDFPNAWAPEQMFIIEGLRHSAEGSQSESLNEEDEAFTAAQKWVTTTYNGWKETGNMFEKYDCRVAGAPGGGISSFRRENFLKTKTDDFLRWRICQSNRIWMDKRCGVEALGNVPESIDVTSVRRC